MDALMNGLGFLAGLVLVYRAGSHIEAMNRRSNHFLRLAYYMIAVGGAALILAPFAQDEEWMQTFGWMLASLGLAILFVFDQRRPGGHEKRHPVEDQ